jgi:serine protease Do
MGLLCVGLALGCMCAPGYGFSLFGGAKQSATHDGVDATMRRPVGHEQKDAPLFRSPKPQQWRPVQEKVRDTVVQIFSQIAEFDWLQPYRTPVQGAARGSGFLINEHGDIITNAHVVDQAVAVWIQIPSLGKQLIDVAIVSICPERDLALLRIEPEQCAVIKKILGRIPFLPLGDSDSVYRADDVLALGYPLGQESLKSTTGVVSGRESQMIQTSAPINPGNSGGPLLNTDGEVIGINSAGILEAQNIGYAIPVNNLKVILADLYKEPLLRKPFIGVLSQNVTPCTTSYLGNPGDGGCYVLDVVKNSPLDKAGVKAGDMLYEINGNHLDIYGEMSVPWSEDKISILDYISRLSIGQEVSLVVYRAGERKEVTVRYGQSDVLPVRRMFPGYEPIDYEVFAGMVIMQLSLNHVELMVEQVPGLAKYQEPKNQEDPALIITHIFPSAQLNRARTVTPGVIIREINGQPVQTLEHVREAWKKSLDTGYLIMKVIDTVTRASDNVLVVLPFEKIVQEEPLLARYYHYPLSTFAKEIVHIPETH